MMIRRGYLTHYDECFFEIFSSWKVCYAILYYDGTFEYYTDGKDSQYTNRIRLDRVFKYIAVGKICNMVPNRPDLPGDVPIDLMIGFPCVNSKNPAEMEYFYFSDQEDMILWMRAIDSVLPHKTDTSLDCKLVPENAENYQKHVESETINRNDPGQVKTATYYNTNPPYPYGYDPTISTAAGLGLGMGLGMAMTMPLWAMSSAWCPPTIIHSGSPMFIGGTDTITIGNDISMPIGVGDTVTTTVTTTDLNGGFDMNFGNDFGTGFDF